MRGMSLERVLVALVREPLEILWQVMEAVTHEMDLVKPAAERLILNVLLVTLMQLFRPLRPTLANACAIIRSYTPNLKVTAHARRTLVALLPMSTFVIPVTATYGILPLLQAA